MGDRMAKLTKTEQTVSIFLKAEYDKENMKPFTEKKIEFSFQ